MHIAIDLQSCLGGTATTRAAIVRAARELVREYVPAHRFTITLPAHPGSQIGHVRAAFADLLPPVAVEVYALPGAGVAPAAATWLGEAAALVRTGFLTGLGADLVFAPDVDDVDADPTLRTLFEKALAQASREQPMPAAAPARPRLAYISPLPPEPSGIADYSAELLPQLMRFYDVEVVVDQASLSERVLALQLPVRSVAWFEQHADGFDRVLYHFGNSLMHKHMFGLIERHPGVVVLHDFYLANVLHAMHYSGYSHAAMQRALLASHGIGAMQDMHHTAENKVVWKYPCNKPVLDAAEGIIVHSDYARQLARDWYGERAAANWHCLPLLRGHLDNTERSVARANARAALGLEPDQLLVCTFGLLGPTKLNDKLLDAWLASPLVRDERCQLVFVGEAGESEYGEEMRRRVRACRGKRRPQITGYVTPELYQTYLAACDIAVQLRCESRGETSAAILDTLLHGIATVANAHGSSAVLPDSVMIKLEDQVTVEQLSEALVRLRTDASLRATLGRAAVEFIAREHAPDRVGVAYRDALEAIAATSPQRLYRQQVAALRAIGGTAPSRDELIETAKAVALNQPPTGARELLVDISALVQTDLKTGIQRVVRSILQQLMLRPPAGYRIEPVYSVGRNQPYRYARHYLLAPLENHLLDVEDAPAEMRPGDLFLGIDLLIHMVTENRAQLEAFRNRGGQVVMVVYDLLPVLRPDVFPLGTDDYFAEWLRTIGAVADGLVCISRAVADELADWMTAHPPERADPLQIGYFHLGADIDASAPTFGMPPDAPQILAEVKARPSLIMVGTVEPRKGQLQALNAFELLWQAGQDVNLVIVGKEGWMMDALAKRLREHAERGRRLFWLPGVSDEMLLALYGASAALLAPSEGEGFGLPLIEAAQHRLPIVARDLPVFREVAGEHAFYFSGTEPAALAERLTAWLALWRAGKAPSVEGLRWLNWTESAEQLTAAMIDGRWYRAIPGTPAYSPTAGDPVSLIKE